MKKCWMNGVLVACGLMLVASAASADKGEIEKKAKETAITLSLKQVTVSDAIDLIAKKSGIAIKTTGIPKDVPKLTMELRHVSVMDAINLVSGVAELSCEVAVRDEWIEVSMKKKAKDQATKGPDPFAE